MPGVHQRLKYAASSSTDVPNAQPTANRTARTRGGVDQRTSKPKEPYTQAAQPAGRQGVHQRLGIPDSEKVLAEEAPLTKTHRKHWARGRTPTTDCLKYAKKAKASGATDLGGLWQKTLLNRTDSAR